MIRVGCQIRGPETKDRKRAFDKWNWKKGIQIDERMADWFRSTPPIFHPFNTTKRDAFDLISGY